MVLGISILRWHRSGLGQSEKSRPMEARGDDDADKSHSL